MVNNDRKYSVVPAMKPGQYKQHKKVNDTLASFDEFKQYLAIRLTKTNQQTLMV